MIDDLPYDQIIEDYDDLTTGEIKPLLADLYDDELDVIREHETANKNRAVVLAEISRLKGMSGPVPSGPVPGPPFSTPAPPTMPTVCQEPLCQQPNDPPGSYYCELHETLSNQSRDYQQPSLLAQLLIEMRAMNAKLDDLLTEQQIQRIRESANGGPG